MSIATETPYGSDCGQELAPVSLDNQRNALRVEFITPATRCALKMTDHAKARNISVTRWVLSGGDPSSIANPCSGNCPLLVDAEDRMMSDRKSGPCPVCRTRNTREGYGEVSCKECGLEYKLVGGDKV